MQTISNRSKMTPEEIIEWAKSEGIYLSLSQGRIRATGSDAARGRWKPIFLENRSAIFALLSQAQNEESAIPATKPQDKGETVAKIATVAVANPISNKSISVDVLAGWEDLIYWWLDHIEESDPVLHNACLNQCRRDAEARKYFLSHAILEFRKTQNEVNHD